MVLHISALIHTSSPLVRTRASCCSCMLCFLWAPWDLHAHLAGCGTTCGELVREWLISGFAAALETKALRLLWDRAFHQDQGRVALVAAAVAVLKWAEEELLSETTATGVAEVLEHAASNCLEPEDFATAVDIWIEAIPLEEHRELRKDARAEIAAQRPVPAQPVVSVAEKLQAAAGVPTKPIAKPMMTVAQQERAKGGKPAVVEGDRIRAQVTPAGQDARLEDFAPVAATAY